LCGHSNFGIMLTDEGAKTALALLEKSEKSSSWLKQAE
jgi:hypothetical protein